MSQYPLLSESDIKELSQNKTILLYDGLVMDLTEFGHPGGPQLLYQHRGTDIKSKFDSLNHSHNAKRMIVHHTIGRICNEE